jgi:predicted RNase H-like HicB family nuclease
VSAKEKIMSEKKVNEIALNLHVLFEENDNRTTAHCLDFDVVTQGANREEAEEMLKDAVFEHVLFAVENNLIHKLYDPAPPEFWEKYYIQKFKNQNAYQIRKTHSLVMEIEAAYA